MISAILDFLELPLWMLLMTIYTKRRGKPAKRPDGMTIYRQAIRDGRDAYLTLRRIPFRRKARRALYLSYLAGIKDNYGLDFGMEVKF